MRNAIYKLGAILGVVLLMLIHTGATRPSSTQVIDISAQRFRYMPNEITVKRGKPVTLVFHSEDVTHGFAADDFNVKVDIPKHQTAQVTFTPDKVGDFTGKCAHFCGVGHGQMQMTIHVTE